MNYSNPYNNVKGQLKDDKDQRLNSGLHGNEYDSIYSEGHNKNTSKYQVISPPVMYKKQRAEDNALYRGYVNNSETMTNEVVHSAGISEEKFGDYLTNSKIYARKLPELKETKIIKEQKSPYLDSGLLRPYIKDPVAFIKRPKVKGRLNINLSAKKEIVGSLYAGVMNPQQPVPNEKELSRDRISDNNSQTPSRVSVHAWKFTNDGSNENCTSKMARSTQRPSSESVSKRHMWIPSQMIAPTLTLTHAKASTLPHSSELLEISRFDIENSSFFTNNNESISQSSPSNHQKGQYLADYEPEEKVQRTGSNVSCPENFPFAILNTQKSENLRGLTKIDTSLVRPASALSLLEAENVNSDAENCFKGGSLTSIIVEKKEFASTAQNFRVTTIKTTIKPTRVEQKQQNKSLSKQGSDTQDIIRGQRELRRRVLDPKSKQEPLSANSASKNPYNFQKSEKNQPILQPKSARNVPSRQGDVETAIHSKVNSIQNSDKRRDDSPSKANSSKEAGDNSSALARAAGNSALSRLDPLRNRAKQTVKEKTNNNTKYFVYNSQDDHIKRALKRFGWVESTNSSQFVQFKWVYTDQENDYRFLQEGQFYNHIPNNKELTTKNGLMNTFRRCQLHGVDSEQFFPRCFDLGSLSQIQEFKDDYEQVTLMILVQKLWRYIKMRAEPGKLEKIKKKYEKWQHKEPNAKNKRSKSILRNIILTEKEKNPNFIIHNVLVEVILLCTKTMLQQYTEVMDELGFYSLQKIHKKTKEQILQYSKFSPPYEKIPPQELALLGGTDHCWQTPNEWAIYKIYKYKKMFKSVMPQFSINGLLNIWIIKPGSNARGQGIHLIDSIEEAVLSGAQNQGRIVQKYMENPLIVLDPEYPLLYKKKFDIRQWVLVTSIFPLKIYLFSSCYLRICSAEFDLNDIKDSMKHLTNFAVNKAHYKGRMEDSVCSLDYFARYIHSKHNIDWDVQIKPSLISLITETLISVSDQLESKSGCFELYGFDILLDEDFKPWLLEVNLSPACTERTPWLTEMLDHMAEGLLKLVLPKAVLSTEDVPDPDTVSLPRKNQYQWELIHTGDEVHTLGANANVIITKDLELTGTRVDIKKEKELDILYYRYMASLKIQKLARGFLCRRRIFRKKQNVAAIIIQKNSRVCLAKNAKKALIHMKASRIIYNLIRINHARNYVIQRRRSNASTQIQSYVRMKFACKLLKQLRKERAALRIQCMFRKFKAQKSLIRMRHRLNMIKKIQKVWKKRYVYLMRCATIIQSIARMLKAIKIKQKLKKTLTGVIKIQSAWRGKSARLKLEELKVIKTKKQLEFLKVKRYGRLIFGQFLNEKKIRKAVSKIDKLRRRVNFWKVYIWSVKINRAAEKIQGLFKIIKSKRRCNRIRRVRKAIRIQAYFRMYITRKKYLRNILRRKSAIVIQKAIRRFLASNRKKLIKKRRDEEIRKQIKREQIEAQRKTEMKKRAELEKKQQELAKRLVNPYSRKPLDLKPEIRASKTPPRTNRDQNKMEKEMWSLSQYEKGFSIPKLRQDKTSTPESSVLGTAASDATKYSHNQYAFNPSDSPYKRPKSFLVERDNFQTLYGIFSKKH